LSIENHYCTAYLAKYGEEAVAVAELERQIRLSGGGAAATAQYGMLNY